MQGQTFSRIICNFMTRIVAIPDFAKMWNVIFEHARQFRFFRRRRLGHWTNGVGYLWTSSARHATRLACHIPEMKPNWRIDCLAITSKSATSNTTVITRTSGLLRLPLRPTTPVRSNPSRQRVSNKSLTRSYSVRSKAKLPWPGVLLLSCRHRFRFQMWSSYSIMLICLLDRRPILLHQSTRPSCLHRLLLLSSSRRRRCWMSVLQRLLHPSLIEWFCRLLYLPLPPSQHLQCSIKAYKFRICRWMGFRT